MLSTATHFSSDTGWVCLSPSALDASVAAAPVVVSLGGSALTPSASAVSEAEPELDGLELASLVDSTVDLDS